MKVTMFVLPLCPYCKRADRIINELQKENPQYGIVQFERYNELSNIKMASEYDYYHVPAFFYGEEKLYEATPDDDDEIMYGKIKAMFETLMEK